MPPPTCFPRWLSAVSVGRLARAGPRSRRLGITVASSFVGKAVSFVVQLLQLPLLVAAVGADRYGEAVAIMAWLALLPAFDMGFGAAVKNATADRVGSGQAGVVRRIAALGMTWSAGLALLLGGLVVATPAMLGFLPGADSILPLLRDDSATRAVGAVMVAAALPLATAGHVADGMQLGWLVNTWRMVGAVVGLVAIAMVAATTTARWQVIALLGLPAIVAGVGMGIAVARRLPAAHTASKAPEEQVSLPRLIRDGLPFMLPFVASLLVNNAPQVAIFATDGPPAVARYAVGQRLMSLLLQPLMFAVAPLWPALAEARAAGDEAWAVRQVGRAWRVGIVYSVVATAVATTCGRAVAVVWMGHTEAVPTPVEMAAIAVAAGTLAVTQPGAMMLNAYRRFRVSTVVAILQIGVALAYEPLARLAGPAAVPAAQAAFGLLVMVPAVIMESRAALRR